MKKEEGEEDDREKGEEEEKKIEGRFHIVYRGNRAE